MRGVPELTTSVWQHDPDLLVNLGYPNLPETDEKGWRFDRCCANGYDKNKKRSQFQDSHVR